MTTPHPYWAPPEAALHMLAHAPSVHFAGSAADGQPIALENGWYPRDLLPGLDRQDLGGSLYEIFRTVYGLAIDSAEQTLWGEGADAATARRLDAPLNTPLLVFRRVSAADGRPLEYVVSRYRGDRYQLHMSLQGNSTGTGTTEGTKQ